MADNIRTRRFLIDRPLTEQDMKQMEYWTAVRDSEIERCTRVVNSWEQLKQQERARGTHHH